MKVMYAVNLYRLSIETVVVLTWYHEYIWPIVDESLSEGRAADVTQTTLPLLTTSALSVSHGSHDEMLSTSFSRSHHQQQQIQQSAQSCLVLLCSVRAHQLSINLMHCQGDHVVTASNDHTLKVASSVCCYCTPRPHRPHAEGNQFCLLLLSPPPP